MKIWNTRLTVAVLAACLMLSLGGCGQASGETASDAAEPPAQEESAPDTAAQEPAEEASEPESAAQESDESDESNESQSPFASFTAQDLDGNEVTQEIFADYPVTLVNVWGTFCGPCLEEMPYLGELAQEYEAKGLQVVGIVGDAIDLLGDGSVLEDVVAEAKADVEETGADYLHIVPTGELFPNLMKQLYAYPTTLFVDSEGNIVGDIIMGARSKDEWSSLIETMLEQADAGEAPAEE